MCSPFNRLSSFFFLSENLFFFFCKDIFAVYIFIERERLICNELIKRDQ